MLVREKKRANPRKQGVQPQPEAQPYTFPAPIRGWVLNESLASAQPGGARLLDNWVCTTTGARVRGGAKRYATVGDPVKALFSYKSTTSAFFAATETDIYDITTVADPDVAPTADLSSLTSGDWSTVQFGTAGGDYLVCVNGADEMRQYDGSTWTTINGASTPAITGVNTDDLSHVWSHGSRLWFVKSGTLEAYYLPVDSIAGSASAFSLAGVFQKGGALLFGARWSLDAGDGLDDKCVFVSTEGEIAVYSGTNPASAADWRLQGRYDMPRPLGKNAVSGAGGDLLIATSAGLIPISAAIGTDLGAIETKAVSAKITPFWLEKVTSYPEGWVVRKFNRAGYMVVAYPDGESCLTVNLLTGAWSRFTGWDVACMAEYGPAGYFGGASGRVYTMEVGGSDDGAIYTSVFLGLHDAMGAVGEKTIAQMRPKFRFSTAFTEQVSATADFSTAVSAPPSEYPETDGDVWDLGVWDVSLWDAGVTQSVQAVWAAVGVSGTYLAPEIQITSGSARTPIVELVSIDAMYRAGANVE